MTRSVNIHNQVVINQEIYNAEEPMDFCVLNGEYTEEAFLVEGFLYILPNTYIKEATEDVLKNLQKSLGDDPILKKETIFLNSAGVHQVAIRYCTEELDEEISEDLLIVPKFLSHF